MITVLFLYLTVIISMKGILANYGKAEFASNLPKVTDLEEYLTSLEKIIDFSGKHKLYIDLNYVFGLFLVNVNLKKVLRIKSKNLDPVTRDRFEKLMVKNNYLRNYFRYMVVQTKDDSSEDQSRQIAHLFLNETEWPRFVQKYNLDLLEKTKIYTPVQLLKIYGNFETYQTNLEDFDNAIPSTYSSDSCMALLAETEQGTYKRPGYCASSTQCQEGIKSGSEYGYALSHRLLYLLQARYARCCIVFSNKEDRNMMDKICQRQFNEARYIALQDYKLPDMMMEQMVLCSLVGHAQFLQRTWINNLFRYQTSIGCFSEDEDMLEQDELSPKESPDDHWVLSGKQQSMMNGVCNSHTTAVASAMVSSAIRFILESYY